MTFRQELDSWLFPTAVDVDSVPQIGAPAPSSPQLGLSDSSGRPTVLAFLRHCGCPFAEKTFRNLRSSADAHPDIRFIAISHSDQEATNKWLQAVGGAGKTEVIVDDERKLFGKWGLGVSSFWHVLNPFSMTNIFKMGRSEGIWNRPTESGSRWQTSGSFAVDGKGIVTWGGASKAADDIPDYEHAVKSVR